MNDDAVRAVWLSFTQAATPKSRARRRSNRSFAKRVANQQERRIRILLDVALIVLCPVLLWAAAHGRTPLVRGGRTGLMAIGVSVLVAAEWLWLRWSRQGLPGPADTRAQLRTAVFVLARQAGSPQDGAAVVCADLHRRGNDRVLDRSSAQPDRRCGARCRDWSGVGGGRRVVLREGTGDRRAAIPVGAGAGRSQRRCRSTGASALSPRSGRDSGRRRPDQPVPAIRRRSRTARSSRSREIGLGGRRGKLEREDLDGQLPTSKWRSVVRE